MGERAALEQAIYDFLEKRAPTATVEMIRVSTRGPNFPRQAKYYYRKFAVALIRPESGQSATALFGYYVAKLSGWRLLDIGNVGIGCSLPPSIFHGYKDAVLKDLGLPIRCPG